VRFKLEVIRHVFFTRTDYITQNYYRELIKVCRYQLIHPQVSFARDWHLTDNSNIKASSHRNFPRLNLILNFLMKSMNRPF